jgi:PPP family 3-phenylpropionic acid transporter
MTSPERPDPSHQPRATSPAPRLPYWRLSGFYLFYFGVVGLYMPYWPLYLDSLGLTPQSIGIYFGVTSAMRLVSPNFWGWLADHHGRRMPIIRSCLAASCFLFVFLGLVTSLFWLVLLGAVFGFFWTASLPQFEATTLTHLGERVHAYSNIRIWGSLGFIFAVSLVSWYFEYYSVAHLPWVIVAVMAVCLLVSLIIPERAASHAHAVHEPLAAVLKKRTVFILLFSCFIMQFSHAPYYTFYSIYLQDLGYSKPMTGAMWSLGVVAEVFAFLVMRRLILWWGLRRLMILSLALASLRWCLIAVFADSIAVLVFAQLLHAATFGVFHGTAVLLIHRYFPGRLQGRGQALYSSLSFGLGVSMGSLISGAMWQPLGAAATFFMAAAVTAVAAILCWRLLQEQA